MKTKNLFLGVAATVFAIGGVFASSMITINAVKLPNGSCETVNPVDCGSGNVLCTVQVTNSPAGTYPAYNTETCQTQIRGVGLAPTSTTFN